METIELIARFAELNVNVAVPEIFAAKSIEVLLAK